MIKRLIICLILILAIHYGSSAQTPQWQWAHGVGGPGPDQSDIMIADSIGNTYEIGGIGSASVPFGSYTSPNSAYGSVYIVKYSPSGSIVWINFYALPSTLNQSIPGPPTFTNMVLDHDGNICTFGIYATNLFVLGTDTISTPYAPSFGSGGNFFAKFNPTTGAVISLKRIGVGSNVEGAVTLTKIISRPNGHFVVLGSYGGSSVDAVDTIGQLYFPYKYCHFIADLDSDGAFTAGKILTVDTSQRARSSPLNLDDMTLSSTGNIYLSGRYDSAHAVTISASWQLPLLSSDSSGFIFLAKFDSAFDFTWSIKNTYRFGSYFGSVPEGNVFQTALAPGLYDNVYLAGGFYADSLFFDTLSIACYRPPTHYSASAFVARFDGSGTAQWLQGYQTPAGTAFINDLASDPLGHVYIYLGAGGNGLTIGSDTLYDCYDQAIVAMLNPDSRLVWVTNSTSGGAVNSGNMAIDGIGDVYLAGQFQFADAYFGADTIIFHTAASGHPYYSDIFTARLGYCQPATPAVSASGPLIWCGADSVRLTAPASHSYLWSSGDTSRSIVVSSTGSYTVYAADSLGCYARSATLSVRACTNPSLSASVSQNVKCYGDSSGQISLAATGGASPYTYMTTPPVSDYHAVHAARYYITATDSDGCHAYDSVTVTQPASPLSITIDTISGTAAGYGEAIAIAAGATPPYSYLWSDQQNTDTAHHLAAGWYSLIVTDSNGCRATDSVYIQRYDGIATLSDGGISSYPNPSSGRVYIQSSSDGAIEVYDISGQLMMQGTVSAGLSSIDCGDWPASVYIIQIRKQGLLLFEQKVSISH